MRVIAFDDLTTFADRVRPMLLEREAENCFLLGRMHELSRASDPTRPHSDSPPLMWAVLSSDGRCVSAAMTSTHAGSVRSPPLVVTRAPPGAVAALVAHFTDAHSELTGVSAPVPTVAQFAESWCAASGRGQRLVHGLGLFQLTRVVNPRQPGGKFRAAHEGDADVIERWADAFFRDVGEPESRGFCQRVVAERIAEKRVYLWCNPHPVSMAGWAGQTLHGVRINFVYTPPEQRGRGYASACVAALSQHLLDSGRQFCTLFTDLANPTTNRIYQAIGFEHVCDFKHIGFV